VPDGAGPFAKRIAAVFEEFESSSLSGGESVGTLFLAQGQTVQSRKRWIGFATQTRGALTLDAGAKRAVAEQGRSLLAIGVVDVEGVFSKGDVLPLGGPGGG